MAKEVVIIGGGIIGLCSAYYMLEKGHKVTIIDKSDMTSGTSYINSGYLSPSHLIPLSSPGAIKNGLKWMLNSSSPLYIKPRLNLDLYKWLFAFVKSSTTKHVNKSIPLIKEVTLFSQKLYDEIKKKDNFNFHYEKKGLLMLCKTQKYIDEESRVVDIAKENGLIAKMITKEDLKILEPNIEIDAVGASYYNCDSHTTPNEFMCNMKNYLIQNGVKLIKNTEVTDVNIKNGVIKNLVSNDNKIYADQFVLAAGSWSSLLSKKLGVKLLLQPGKGYSLNVNRKTNISIPAILAEAKVAITPMNGFTRFAGTMEISGINHKINKSRVRAITQASKKYYPQLDFTNDEFTNVKCGLRPVTPDGLPYIGRSSKCKNLIFATGHAMMGWGMGTATGLAVSEILDNKKTSINIDHYRPDRKF